MINKNTHKEKYQISSEFITEVCDRLTQNKQVRRSLPLSGRLHIDRSLPFLCVYRRPIKRSDQGTNRFVEGEASYLIASSRPKLNKNLSDLVTGIVSALSPIYGAFLLIEIWSRTISSLSEKARQEKLIEKN